MIVINEMAKIDASHAITISAHTTLGTSPIVNFGTAAQKKRYVPLLASGKVLGGFGLTEPSAGSDAASTLSTAVRKGSHYVLNGSKIFITHGGVGEIFVVTAVTEPGVGTKGISSFIVTKESTDLAKTRDLGIGHDDSLPSMSGFSSGKKEDKLGWRASDTRSLIFEDVEVPAENLLGEEGEGLRQFLKTLDDGRIAISALAVGCAQACLELATDYAKGREAFGRPIGANQGVAFPIADVAVAADAARTLTYKAAWLKDELNAGRRTVKEVKQAAAVAKLFSTEAAVTAARTATQVFGGNGFMEEYPVARFYRDAKILEIGEGTSEVQRMVIARGLGLPA